MAVKTVRESTETQVMDAPVKRRYAIRPDRIDAAISAELHHNPPVDGEHIYTSPRVMIFHDANGEAKNFSPIQSIDNGGRSATIGGWFRTTKPEEISRLDEVYVKDFSGDFRKMYPVD